MMKMKQCIGIILVYFTTITPWSVNIHNNTDGQIKVFISYPASAGVCSEDRTVVEKNDIKTISTGWCCPGNIEIKATSGTAYNNGFREWKNVGRLPYTGIKTACRSFDIYVRNLANGDLSFSIDY